MEQRREYDYVCTVHTYEIPGYMHIILLCMLHMNAGIQERSHEGSAI